VELAELGDTQGELAPRRAPRLDPSLGLELAQVAVERGAELQIGNTGAQVEPEVVDVHG
jgi:hypothetical protein